MGATELAAGRRSASNWLAWSSPQGVGKPRPAVGGGKPSAPGEADPGPQAVHSHGGLSRMVAVGLRKTHPAAVGTRARGGGGGPTA